MIVAILTMITPILTKIEQTTVLNKSTYHYDGQNTTDSQEESALSISVAAHTLDYGPLRASRAVA